jgi:RNA polymerase primary sigma factor
MLEKLVEDISAELAINPGATARKLAASLRVDKSTVNSCLYTYKGLFESVGDSPPQWFLVSSPKSGRTPPEPPIPARPLTPTNVQAPPLNLYQWQQEALRAWNTNHCRGIVTAVTGAGKTRLALAAIDQHVRSPKSKAAVIVPTIELLRQWHGLLQNQFPSKTVGMLGGGDYGELGISDILVAVVNSARSEYLGLPDGYHGLFIGDECHRLASEHNRLSLEEEFTSRLGLSATHERLDGLHDTVLIPYFGDVIYELGYKQAIEQNVISHVRVATVAVTFTPDEMAEYVQLSEVMREARQMLSSRYGLQGLTPGEFFTEVSKLAKSGDRQSSIAASKYLSPYRARRTLLAESDAKINALGILSGAIKDAHGTIAFTESIESTHEIVDTFRSRGITAEAFHSKLKPAERKVIFEKFSSGRIQLISAPQVLDEGIDVPEADLAIIVAATSQRRQMVQRMGRVMRKKADGRFARFAILYVKDTHEDPNMGAHEAFFDEVLEIADDWENFDAKSVPEDVREFLQPF